jgi:carboxylesterase type B
MAEKNNVIIVTMNYRLGVFGWLPAPELAKDNALNLGLQDIIASFKWVKQHIAEFGGDPNQITGSGFSAGGILIGALLFAEDGNLKLFERAVMESGFMGPILETLESSSGIADIVGMAANCTGSDRIECLRKMDAKELLKVSYATNYHVQSPNSDEHSAYNHLGASC